MPDINHHFVETNGVIHDMAPVPPTQLMERLGDDNEIFYQLFYQQPGVGHWIQQEAPETVNTRLLDFLASLGG